MKNALLSAIRGSFVGEYVKLPLMDAEMEDESLIFSRYGPWCFAQSLTPLTVQDEKRY